MSKENKESKKEEPENHGPLLTLNNSNSVFKEVVAAKQKATDVTPPVSKSKEKSKPIVQVNQLVKEVQPEPPVIQPEPDLPLEMPVYEITFLDPADGKSEKTLYTTATPIIKDNGMLLVNNAFGCEKLYENIFNQNEIKVNCRKNFENPEFEINTKHSVLIKSIEEQDWMSVDYDQAKEAFDTAVLNAYRTVAKQTPGTQNKKVTTKQTQSQNRGTEQYLHQEGNIPVTRPPLIQDF